MAKAILYLLFSCLGFMAFADDGGSYRDPGKADFNTLIGQHLRFRAEIKRFEGPKSATLDLDGWWGWSQVLIISPEQGLSSFKEGQEVIVEGEVRTLVTNELNRTLGIVHSGYTPIDRKQEIYVSVHKIVAAP